MEPLGCLGALVALAFLVLPIVTFFLAIGQRSRIASLEDETTRLRTAVDALHKRIGALRTGAAPEPAPEAAETESETRAPVETKVETETEAAPKPPPEALPVPPEPPIETAAPVPSEPVPPSRPEEPGLPAVNAAAFEVRFPPEGAPPPETGPATEAEEPPPGPPTPPLSPPSPPGGIGESLRNFDWEDLVGVKLFSWIAGIALALAGVFFLRYSIEHGLLQPPIRMALGFLTGIGLLVACELKVARNYRITANALDAAGIAILYSTLFASHALWNLIPSSVTFPLMILVTVTAVLLSIRRDSVFIALLGLVGGFATPALLSTGQDRPISLFSYLLLLNAGLAWVAYKKRWPVLSVLTLVFTTLYQWGWVVKFLGTSKVPLAAAIFLAFPILTVTAFLMGSRDPDAPSRRTFGASAAIATFVPISLAAYLAAVPAYGARYHLLFGFLLIIDLGLAALAASRRAPADLHAMGAVSTLVVFFVWLGVSYVPAAWPAVLIWIAAFVATYLLTPIAVDRIAPRAQSTMTTFDGPAASAVWVAPLLLVSFAAFPWIDRQSGSPGLFFATLLFLTAAISAFAIVRDTPGMFHLTAIVAIVAEGSWSAKWLGSETLLPTLVAYAAFAALFMAVPIIARRRDPTTRGYDSAVPLLLSLLLLFYLAGGPVAGDALAGITVLLILLVGGLVVGSRSSRFPLAPTIGMAIGWIVLAVWWSTATIVTGLISALTAVALFALVILAGAVWLRRGNEASDRPWNAWFALAGHAFLLIVASRTDLALPPWPLFAVLALLLVAVALAARYLRSRNLLVADAVASQLVLFVWCANATASPWPDVAIVAALVVAAFMLAWRKIGPDATSLSGSAAAFTALFLAQFVANGAATAGKPDFAVVIVAHVLILGAILALAGTTEQHETSVLAALFTALVAFTYRHGYQPDRWWSEMTLATVPYLMIVAYPLVLGRRAKKRIEPHLAAVLASAFYFLFARTSLEWRGFGGAIGLLPLAQAAILVLVLRSLLRIEPPGERTMGRLAMVAGVILAFITIAIPLQLDKEWITIGWALEGAALVWLFRRVPHKGLLWWAVALFAIVFVRLTMNPAVLTYHARSATPIWNWYLYTYAVSAAALFLAAKLAPTPDEGNRRILRPAFATAGTILLFLLLNIEIADFFSKGATITFNFSADLAQDLTYTLGWAIFAIGLLAAGLIGRNRATRIASIVLLLVSVLKGFLHDLMRLGGLYRVGSLIGLAIALALVAVLLQKFVLATREAKEERL